MCCTSCLRLAVAAALRTAANGPGAITHSRKVQEGRVLTGRLTEGSADSVSPLLPSCRMCLHACSRKGVISSDSAVMPAQQQELQLHHKTTQPSAASPFMEHTQLDLRQKGTISSNRTIKPVWHRAFSCSSIWTTEGGSAQRHCTSMASVMIPERSTSSEQQLLPQHL